MIVTDYLLKPFSLHPKKSWIIFLQTCFLCKSKAYIICFL